MMTAAATFATLALASATTLAPVQPTPGVRNVVFTLLKGGNDDDGQTFTEMRHCLSRALALGSSYDHVAFHEGNLPRLTMTRLQAETPGLRFVNVADAFQVPSHVALPVAIARDKAALGYRNMCNFMANEWYHVLSEYDYAMRVDEDVCLQHFEHADPFKAMRERDLVYAYGLEKPESHEETVDTMQPWLRSYAEAEGLAAAPKVDSMFFTNFFVSKVSWWRGASVQKFLDAVMATGNIYSHRWGDAPIQTAALRLYGSNAMARFPVDYLHVSTMVRVPFGLLGPSA